MSQRESCAWCKLIIMGEPVWVERYVCRATIGGPAEYEDVPMHRVCRDKAQSPDYAEAMADEAVDRRREEREGR